MAEPILLLQKMPQNLIVGIEGCGCIGEACGVEEYQDNRFTVDQRIVLIRRSDGPYRP